MANLYSRVRELVTGLNSKDDSELYQVMFDTAAAGMVTISASGCIQACNPALCQIFGYQADELIGRGIEMLMPEAYARNHQAQIDDYLQSGQATVMGRGREVMALHKNGDEFIVHLSVSEMSFAGSRCFTGIVHDLSASIRQKQQAFRDQAWLGNVLDQTPAAVTVKDIDGRYLLLNRRAESLFLTHADKAVGHTDKELFDSHWASIEARTDNEVISGGSARIFVQPILQQGVSRNLLVSKNLLFDAQAQPMGIVSLCLDISSLSALQHKEKNSDNICLNLLPQALALVSSDGDILQANQAYAQRFGMSTAALYDCNLKVVETDTVIQAFHKLLTSDMREMQVNEDGLPGLFMQQYRLDGTEVVLLSSDLPQSSFQSYAGNQAENSGKPASLTDSAQFIASLSHELRTPLNSVIGFSQILKSGQLDEDQHEAVDMIERAGKHLVALVDQVLDLIKIEGAVGKLQSEPFSLLPVINECIELASSLEQQQNIAIHCDLHNPWATGDRIRVKQIVLNLLTNAIKYNRADHRIVIEVINMPGGNLRICVNDEGIGIAEQRQSKIFLPFERLGAEQSAIEGNGLGLAICRQLAERMGGQLDFVSVEGEGSSFWLELATAQPLYSSNHSYRHHGGDEDFELDSACRVLYIEDNLINARFVELGLKARENVDILIAHTGKEGMDKALEQSPDVILLDMRLPDIHGLELLKKLRDIPELKHAKIYGVSAEALPGHISAAEDAGLDGYMTKPLDLNELNEMICH